MAVGFIGYLAIVAAIAFYATKRTSTAHDYVIGGRSLSAPVAALSAGASDMSGWLLLGLPGAVFALGLGEAWIVVGLVCGAWANWRLVAAKLRDYSERLQGAVTLPQFFARRVGARTRAPALVATLLVLFFFAVYTAAGFVAAAKLFESVLGLDYAVALWTGVVLVLALHGPWRIPGGELDRLRASAAHAAELGRRGRARVPPCAGARCRCRGARHRRIGADRRLGLGARLLRAAPCAGALHGNRRRGVGRARAARQSALDEPGRRCRDRRGRQRARLFRRCRPRRPGDGVHRLGRRTARALDRRHRRRRRPRCGDEHRRFAIADRRHGARGGRGAPGCHVAFGQALAARQPRHRGRDRLGRRRHRRRPRQPSALDGGLRLGRPRRKHRAGGPRLPLLAARDRGRPGRGNAPRRSHHRGLARAERRRLRPLRNRAGLRRRHARHRRLRLARALSGGARGACPSHERNP